jgi:hypothetical protein
MNPPLIKSLIFALALASQALADFNCQEGSFISTTVLGKTPDKAREKAKAEIARNIISNIKSSTKITDYSEEINGSLKEYSTFLETSEMESNLTLFGFQELEPPKRQKNGEYELKVYICTKDAAKSFLEKQRLVADSLELASNTALNTKHPKHKNEALRKAQMLWGEFIRTKSLLEVLGVENPYPAEEIYSKAMADYKNYCKSTKVFWQDSGNECSETIFSMLSKKIKMGKSKCLGGLKLSFNCPEKCVGSSLGIECSSNLSLAIESCGGEKYSTLKIKEPIIGSDSYSKNMARENMVENLSKMDFLVEWEKEIMEWVPQCVE